ncbi:hypothetical protein ACFVXG_27680 [Kitasatospora sp. NPDC058162]
MNPVERALRAADRAQQHHTPSAVAVGVVKKYATTGAGCSPL